MSKLHYVPPREEYAVCGRHITDIALWTRSDGEMSADYDLRRVCLRCMRKLGLTRRQKAALESGKTRAQRAADVVRR